MFNSVPILMFHDIHADNAGPKDNFSVAESDFRKQIEYLHHNGYAGVSLANFLKGKQEEESPSHQVTKSPEEQNVPDTRKKVILTFDDGDISNHTVAAQVLKGAGFTATFFITVNEIGKDGRMSWENIYELSRQGMDVGSHGMTHVFFPSMSSYNLLNELLASKQVLEKYIRRRVDFLSVPRGFYNKGILDIARDVGFKAVCVSDAGYNDFLDEDIFCLRRFAMRHSYTLAAFRSIVAGAPQLNVVALENLRTFLRGVLGYQFYHRLRVWKGNSEVSKDQKIESRE